MGYTISENGNETCMIFNSTGAKWSGATLQGVNTAKVIGRNGLAHERNMTKRFAAANDACNIMRNFLSNTQALLWRRLRTLRAAIGPVANEGSHCVRRHHQDGLGTTTVVASFDGAKVANT